MSVPYAPPTPSSLRSGAFGPVSRRIVLGGLLGGSALSLVGCQVDTGGGDTGSEAAGLDIPDYPGDLPTDDVTFRWVDSGDLKSVFVKAVLGAYHDKHANITTSYDGSGWDTVNQVVPLGIRNGSAHDIFALPQDVPAQVAVNQGWVQPLDDIVPDFAAWKAAFPATAFIPGVHVFDGKTYSFPASSTRRLDRMLFFDTEVLKGAGVDDPVATVKTWDDLRATAKKVRDSGKVGLTVGGDGLSGLVTFLALTAGWKANSTGMNMTTGDYAFADAEVVQAVELLQAMVADKTVVPGFLTLLEKDARAQMPAGQTGMILNGPWDIPAWKKAAPDWSYSMAAVPTPQGEGFFVPYRETGANMTFVYAKSKYPVIAGQLAAYMGSVAGQTQLIELSEGNLVSVTPAAVDAAAQSALDPNATTASDLAKQIMRVSPMVELRNDDAGLVTLATKPVTPNLRELMQGLFTGQLDNVEQVLGDYNSAMNSALDEAITAAAKKGSSVTRADFAFANWDPSQDYTADDYQAL